VLLARFASRRDEAAFAALVRRHGPMVLGVCRRLLRDPHDADDAFQAAFLVLVHKARSLTRPGSLGPWLYGVAYRTALKARARAARRRLQERRASAPAPADPAEEVLRRDLRAVLDDELSRLPARYREPLVLCYLEGYTQDEAARRLGCPQKTVTTRLARGRARLRARLARRGLALSAGAAGAALSESAAPAAVPPPLANATHKAATLIAGGKAGPAVSADAVALTQGVLKAMGTTKWKAAAAVLLLTAAAVGVGLGAGAYPARAQRPPDAGAVREGKPAAAAPVPPRADGGKEATEKRPAVNLKQRGRDSTFSAGLSTQLEGLALAMLGSCSVEAGEEADVGERWKQLLKGEHLHIGYASPRPVGVDAAEGEFEASEILIPLPPEGMPDHVYVRVGDRYRAFANCTPQTCQLLYDALELKPAPRYLDKDKPALPSRDKDKGK
jgi:RNA polymerase sigma factor (sigma-70 family)